MNNSKNNSILIGGEKGGTGKSTIALNLALMSAIKGKDVILLDCDKQGTSHKFISHRNELSIKPTPPCVQIRGKHLGAEIENLASRYEVVIIDAGGQDSVEMRSAMVSPSVAKMYIPVQASTFDLQTLFTIDELVGDAQLYNTNLQAIAVINRASTHSKITNADEAAKFINSLENIQLCEIRIYERIAFQYAVIKAESVYEFEQRKIKEMPKYRADKYKPKATSEIFDLYEKTFGDAFKEATSIKSKSDESLAV